MRYASIVALAAAGMLAAGCVAPEEAPPKEAAAAANPWDGSGFSVYEVKDLWWVFLEKSKELKEFVDKGEPAKSVTRIGAGPGGRTVRGPDAETLDAFACWKPGFSIRVQKGRTWIFKEGAKELAEFDRAGDIARNVTRLGAGPDGATLKSVDFETLDAWAARK